MTQAAHDKTEQERGRPPLSIWRVLPGPVFRVRPGLEAEQRLHFLAAQAGVSVADIKGPSRVVHIVRARQQVCAELYATGRYSLPGIGGLINRDHTTVLHGVKAHAKRQAAKR